MPNLVSNLAVLTAGSPPAPSPATHRREDDGEGFRRVTGDVFARRRRRGLRPGGERASFRCTRRCQKNSLSVGLDRSWLVCEPAFFGGGRSLILNFEAMEGRGETETGAMWVRLTREYDAMCVLFGSLVEWW
ncbi:hypothetical protein N9M16_06050, partial [Candidatus Dependentiae bacterium]|nr:hypothetical protein [Candidatus Dependentiae bacterium]